MVLATLKYQCKAVTARVRWRVSNAGWHIWRFICSASMIAWGATGCGPTINPSFDSPEPAARNAAIVRAAGSQDKSAVSDLVRMLDSDDPATRLLAIVTLEGLTGERFGYEHGASEVERNESIEKWEAYLKKTNELEGIQQP